MNEFTFEELAVGQTASFQRSFTVQEVDEFTKLTGDVNPLHSSDEYAQTTEFKGRVVHGMLAASLFSTLVGVYLPGKYCLYLSQEVSFHKPVKPGQELTVTGKILARFSALRMLEVETKIFGASGNLLVNGKARVRVLK